MSAKDKSAGDHFANACVHFNGVQNNTCKAGVHYDTLSASRSLPCIRHLAGDAQCSQRRFPNEQEIAVQVAEDEKHTAQFLKAVQVINQVKRENKGRNWRGVLTCPACSGKLHMAHAGCNGHTRGKCETNGCLAWIE